MSTQGLLVARRRILCVVPELPEVESVRRSLLPHVLGRVIVAAVLRRRDVLVAPGDPFGGMARQRGSGGGTKRKRVRPAALEQGDLLEGARVVEIIRHGKQLVLLSESGRGLGVQLGMTGAVEVLERGAEPEEHTHAVWTLEDKARFVFRDPRRFGGLRVFRTREAIATHLDGLGPDALTITGAALREALRGAERGIKSVLLDQEALAGVGNIYADEALHAAGIHPRYRASLISAPETEVLAEEIRRVLKDAVELGGSTIRDYADAAGERGAYQDRHAVYGRGGLPCRRCGRTLSKGLVGQRTTVWCERCQPLGRARAA